MSPQSLNVVGATQVEIFRETVNDIVMVIQRDAGKFWTQAMISDGPLEIWEIRGLRYLSNGNHRYQAAILAGVDIPAESVVIVDKSSSSVLTFRFDQMVWLSGRK